jgi:excisionase family DNA binding protein
MSTLPKLYCVEDVANHVGISVRTVKRFIASGKLKATSLAGRHEFPKMT